MLHGIKRSFIPVITILVISVIIEYMMVLNISDFVKACKNQETEQIYGKGTLQFKNCTVSEDGEISSGGDPQIIINDVNAYVSFLEICVQDLPFSVLPGYVSWTDDVDPDHYTEERSVRFLLREDQGAVTIPLNQTVKSLRFGIPAGTSDTWRIRMITVNPHALVYLKHNVFRMSWVRIIVYFLLILTVFFALVDWRRFKRNLYQYRWGIGIAVIAICTLLKVHGSSIGIVAEWLTGADTSRLWLQSRGVRSDEFVAYTQMALSQANSGFRWFSNTWGYSPSDMFIVYGQPIWNIVTLFRPFSAGYLLFGPEYGLSFYWSSRLIVCWLVSFEFGRILTNDEKKLSAAYACLIALSPLVHWWFSVNELVEMLVFGQGAIVLFHVYIREDRADRVRRLLKKAVLVLGLMLCSGGYVLSFYPAWMVPFFYVFFACGVSFILENRFSIHIRIEDVVLFLLGVVLLLCSMAYIYSVSKGTIQAVMNTVYPGKRTFLGGPEDNVIHLFRGWSSWVWTFAGHENPCESVDFISFFPLGIFMSAVVLFCEKKRDIWLILLNLISVFLIIYLVFGMPEFVAKITLMQFSTIRAVNAVGMLQLIALVRAMSISRHRISRYGILLANSIVILAVVFTFYHSGSFLPPALRGIVLIIALGITNIILLYNKNRGQLDLFLAFAVLIGIVGGVFVNPVSSGLGNIFHSDVLQVVRSINNEDEGTWAVNGPLAFSNLPATVGAKSITALATYPDNQLWETLGLTDEESEKIWNRYAHIEMKIADETRIELRQADIITLYITLEDLRRLGVKYILSFEDVDGDLPCLYVRESVHIYRLDP